MGKRLEAEEKRKGRRRKTAACLGKDSKLQSGRAHWKSAAERQTVRQLWGGFHAIQPPLSGLVRERDKFSVETHVGQIRSLTAKDLPRVLVRIGEYADAVWSVL